MNNNYFMLGQNEAWKNLHKEKVEIFREKLTKIPPPPQNSRCFDVYNHLQKYVEDPHDKDQVGKMQNSLKLLNRIEDIPKTKGRLCGGLLSKGDKAYKCHDCMTEDNSVLCPKCFELDKHVGHDFQRFQVFGGCCDCGDVQKWKEEGFCTEHSKDEEIEVILDEKIVELFLQEQLYALKLLLIWYAELENFKKTIKEESWSEVPPVGDIEVKLKNEAIKLARIIVDTYGGCWVGQLVEFNKAGKFANTMTQIFFRQQIRVPLPGKQSEQVSKSVLLHLFSMTSLKITPQKVSDLCITMFPMVGFRQTVTEVYVNFYNNDPSFPPSDYTHLSSQLLTSYMAISKLVKEGRMNALRFEPVCQNYSQIQSIAEGYLRYYYDIRYLAKLYGDASIDYFKLHGEQKKFVSLGYYRIILDQFDNSIDYYGLDEIFLERMMPLIKVIERDPTQSISNMALRELYRFIATSKTSNHNKFRPQERLFTWIFFVRIKGDLSLLQNDQFVKQIFGILGVENFHQEIAHIISNLSSVFSTASKMIENINEIESKYTFYSFYMKKSQNLFNLDSLLLKIALKLCEFYKRQHPFFEYSTFLIANEINPTAMIVKPLQEIDDPGDVIKIVRHLINYVSIVLEAIFSDLPILALSSIHDRQTERIEKFQPLKMNYEVLALHYYQCLIRGEERDKIQVKVFKKNAENFFKEEKIFKTFVQQFKDPTDSFKIIKKEGSGPQINSMYFKSLCSIPSEKYNSTYYLPPYMKWKKNEIVNVFLHPLSVSTQVIKRIYNDFQETEENFKNKLVPYIIIELWKINLFSQSAQSAQILDKLLSKKWIQAQVHSLDKKILSQIYSKEHLGGNDSEAKRKQQNRKKFQQKKALMNQKMNKNAEKILQSESIFNNEASETKNQSDFTCCLCKQATEETLYLLGFVTFTSGNGWLGISQHHNCIPIFDSCGHAVHRSCYLKIMANNNTNRVYLYCPLCKQPTNILLPEQETLSQECIELFLSYLMKIYQTLQYKADENDLKNAICKSLIFQMIIKGCTMYHQFLKNIKTFKILYKIYASFLEKDKETIEEKTNNVKFKILALDNTTPQLFWDINSLLASILNKNKEFSKQLSQIFIEHSFSLLGLLEGNSPMLNQVDPPEQKAIQNSIVFPKLESNLATMNSKYRGKCLQCGLVTNNQMICLNCPNFVTCTNCNQVKLIDHSNQFHTGLTVYVKTSTGEPLYLMRNRCWKFQSLYEDYMGRIYDSSTKLREDFQLNESRLSEIKKDILTMKIERKVRYQENQTKKIYNQEIF